MRWNGNRVDSQSQCQSYSRYLPNRINFYEFCWIQCFVFCIIEDEAMCQCQYITCSVRLILFSISLSHTYSLSLSIPARFPISNNINTYMDCTFIYRMGANSSSSTRAKKSIERKCGTIKNTFYSWWQIHTSNTVKNIQAANKPTASHYIFWVNLKSSFVSPSSFSLCDPSHSHSHARPLADPNVSRIFDCNKIEIIFMYHSFPFCDRHRSWHRVGTEAQKWYEKLFMHMYAFCAVCIIHQIFFVHLAN